MLSAKDEHFNRNAMEKMVDSRAKGQRTLQKAIRYAKSLPASGIEVLVWYQISGWYRKSTSQCFDLVLLRPDYWPRMVEVRTTAWGVAKAQTRQLARLPGTGYLKQIWRFTRGATTPDIRQWSGTAWVSQAHPWESADE